MIKQYLLILYKQTIIAMKKLMLLVSIIAIVAISCKKEKTPQPDTSNPPAVQMYCQTFVHFRLPNEPDSIPQIDTVARLCLDQEHANDYVGIPVTQLPQWLLDLGANGGFIPQPIGDCSECQ